MRAPRGDSLTFCPDRGLRHGIVHNADEQEGTDAGGDLKVAVRDDLEVPRRVHALKVDARPVLLGVGEHRVGRCGVADERGPDAREGRYRMAHDARGELFRLLVARGEAARRVARFAGELPEDRQRGSVVPDDAAVPCTPWATPSARVQDDAETRGGERGGGGREGEAYLVLSRMNVSPQRWRSSLMVHPRKARETCRRVIIASHLRILLGKSIMSPMYSPMAIAAIV